jgi:TPR repeat protein
MLGAGDGVPADRPRARTYLNKGCQLGDRQGCEMARLE